MHAGPTRCLEMGNFTVDCRKAAYSGSGNGFLEVNVLCEYVPVKSVVEHDGNFIFKVSYDFRMGRHRSA